MMALGKRVRRRLLGALGTKLGHALAAGGNYDRRRRAATTF